MPEQHLVRDSFSRERFVAFVQSLELSGKPWLFKWTRHNPNSYPMKKLWFKWMQETADFMARNGVTMPQYLRANGQPFGKRAFDKDDAHKLFKNQYFAAKYGADVSLTKVDKVDMLHGMDRHIAWATERGLFLTIPGENEYSSLKAEQER